MISPSISHSRPIQATASTTTTSTSTKEFPISACDFVSARIHRRNSRNRSLSSSSSSNSSYSRSPTRTTQQEAKPLVSLFVAIAVFFFAQKNIAPVLSMTAAKNEWINNSLQYYNKVTRGAEHVQQSPTYLKSAMENYFAREKIRENKPHHAELIYRRLIMDENQQNHHNTVAATTTPEEEECPFSNLAVPTLLLGLLLQKEGRYTDARVVFEGFTHVLQEAEGGVTHTKCSCCARVLQAHALFEMKQENPIKAAELIIRAVRMDRNLRPVLRWKLFREAIAEYQVVQRLRRFETKKQQQRQLQSHVHVQPPFVAVAM